MKIRNIMKAVELLQDFVDSCRQCDFLLDFTGFFRLNRLRVPSRALVLNKKEHLLGNVIKLTL